MAKLQEKHIEYLQKYDFYENYIRLLNGRLVYSNNSIENDNMSVSELYDHPNVLSLKDNYDAFYMLLKEMAKDNEHPLTEKLIIKIANTINKHSMYISDGYRKGLKGLKLSEEFPISDPEYIEEDMKNLLDKYYGDWQELDVFEREARFNIEFIRIHPFEDGNGRTSRLILNFNLLIQGHAPVIIPEIIREEYFVAMDYNDIDWIKRMFMEESENELKALDMLIDSYESDRKVKR